MSLPPKEAPAPAWIPALLAGDRAALSRAITAVENETPEAQAVLRAIHGRLGRALVVGFTGAPGAGKSTLVGAYVAEVRRRGLSVGVVAVDPSSPRSGGALLGDRIRMRAHDANDPGVFIRSLAARGHLGGLSRTASRVIDAMDAAGRAIVVVETVGAGQNEVEVAEIADIRVVVLSPGQGDEVQAIKAGILEIADLLVVNKADLPLADITFRQLRARRRQGENGADGPHLCKTIATTGEGVEKLADAIADAALKPRPGRRAGPEARLRALLASLAAERARQAIERGRNAALDEILARLAKGEIGFEAAADEALAALGPKLAE